MYENDEEKGNKNKYIYMSSANPECYIYNVIFCYALSMHAVHPFSYQHAPRTGCILARAAAESLLASGFLSSLLAFCRNG